MLQEAQDACKATEDFRHDLQARILHAEQRLEAVKDIKAGAPKPYVKGRVFCTHCQGPGHYNARSDACVLHAAHTSIAGESRERQDGVFCLPALENSADRPSKRTRLPSASDSKASAE